MLVLAKTAVTSQIAPYRFETFILAGCPDKASGVIVWELCRADGIREQCGRARIGALPMKPSDLDVRAGLNYLFILRAIDL